VHHNLVTEWRRQLLEHAADVFGGTVVAHAPTVDLKALHARIGQLALENGLLDGARSKAPPRSRPRGPASRGAGSPSWLAT